MRLLWRNINQTRNRLQMKTYEGTMTIKWYKNDSGGDKRPLTLIAKDKIHLKSQLKSIRKMFIEFGDDPKEAPPYRKYNPDARAYSVQFEIYERK